MSYDLGSWENFPTVPANPRPRHYANRFEAAVNRFAERFVSVIIAGAPYFYGAFFAASLAAEFGIIS